MTSDDRSPGEDTDGGVQDFDVVRHEFSAAEDPAVAIIEAVAAATGTPPTELPPLQDTVDGDALDALLRHRPADPAELHVSFAYAGARIEVSADGSLEIRPGPD